MPTTWLSTYGNTYFGVASVGAALASIIFFLLAFVIVCILAKRTPSTINDMTTMGCLCMGFVALLQITAQILWVLAASGISGIGYLGTSSAGGMFVVAALPLLWVVPFVVTSLSPRLWKGHAAYSSSSKLYCFGVVGFVFSASLRSVGLKPTLVWSLMVVSLTITALAFLGLQGLCYCSNPDEVSSWASRRVSPPFCHEGTICHSYFLLGESPDTLTLVLQWVDGPTGRGAICVNAEAVICEVGAAGGACTTPLVTIPATKIIPYHYLSEDLRTVAHLTLTNLRPSQGYRVEARLLDATGNRANPTLAGSSSVLYPKTMQDLSDTTDDISFVGGGDYYMGNRGIETLMAALQVTPNAQFIFLGGDLSYSNNMRTCYRRMDQFFIELTRARTNAHGWALPITVMPGNHESGGYIENDDYQDTASNFQYMYREYFPFVKDRAHKNEFGFYHAHEIGAGVGLLTLDTGCFSKVESQLSFIEENLRNWSSSALPMKRFPIPMIHVSGFPGADRDSSADVEAKKQVKEKFSPLFDRYNVSVVFQNHEHVYFRSKEIDPQGNAVSSPNRGIVYLGDGAMGVAKSSRQAIPVSGSNRAAVTFSEIQFAYSIKFFNANRSLHVDAVSPTDVDVLTASRLGKVLDVADVGPRN